jgi:hypothetical protein
LTAIQESLPALRGFGHPGKYCRDQRAFKGKGFFWKERREEDRIRKTRSSAG